MATTIAQALAGLLLLAAGVLYIPMLTGLTPLGGDMVGLLFVGISVVTTVSLFALSAGAYALLYFHHRSRRT